jgi:hypothetical protein
MVIRKNKDKVDNKNATTWFFVWEEKNKDNAIKEEATSINPRYPIRISGKYNLDKNDSETGNPKVNAKAIMTSVINAKNLARIICVSETGRVASISIVLVLFSSAKALIDNAGIKTKKSQGIREKNGLIDADPTKKISLINKKLAKTPKRITIIYPTGLLR